MRHLYFIGVSTGSSSIMTIFPAWASALGLEAKICGIDVPVDASGSQVREALALMQTDVNAAGALVTTHKAAMYEACGDRFDQLDDWARLCREVSCVALRSGRVLGWAKDPITSRQAYTHLLGDEPWQGSTTDVVCLGAGGAGLALTVAVLGGRHQPGRYVLTDRDPARLDLARDVVGRLPVSAAVDYHLTRGVADADALVRSAAPGSLVVNATGMGKDRPGSPVSDAVAFPREAAVWDMNYRGDLKFLDQARAQERERNLVVADGWRYFLHGWTEVISEVFETPIGDEQFARLDGVAGALTGRASTAMPGAGRV